DDCDGDAPTLRVRVAPFARTRARWAAAALGALLALGVVGYAAASRFPHRAAPSDGSSSAPTPAGAAPGASPPGEEGAPSRADPTDVGPPNAAPPSDGLYAALDRAAAQASHCTAPRALTADVSVTVAPSGRVNDLRVSPASLASTTVGRCITMPFG